MYAGKIHRCVQIILLFYLKNLSMLEFGEQFPANTEQWPYFTEHFFKNCNTKEIIRKTVKVIVNV